MDQDEIRDTVVHVIARRPDFLDQPHAPNFIMPERLLDMGAIAKCRDGGALGGDIDVERRANAVQRVRYGFGAVAPAHANTGQAVHFRESSRHHHIA